LYLEKATNIPQEISDVESDSLDSEESFDQILSKDSDDESNSFECNDEEFFEKNYNHNIEIICLDNPKGRKLYVPLTSSSENDIDSDEDNDRILYAADGTVWARKDEVSGGPGKRKYKSKFDEDHGRNEHAKKKHHARKL
jgi:hypothetical protein